MVPDVEVIWLKVMLLSADGTFLSSVFPDPSVGAA
jgi:hypothetical protein